jgi:hypothetical protein
MEREMNRRDFAIIAATFGLLDAGPASAQRGDGPDPSKLADQAGEIHEAGVRWALKQLEDVPPISEKGLHTLIDRLVERGLIPKADRETLHYIVKVLFNTADAEKLKEAIERVVVEAKGKVGDAANAIGKIVRGSVAMALEKVSKVDGKLVGLAVAYDVAGALAGIPAGAQVGGVVGPLGVTAGIVLGAILGAVSGSVIGMTGHRE